MTDRRMQAGRRESDQELSRAKMRLVWAYAAFSAVFATMLLLLVVWSM